MNGTYHGPESLDIGHVRHVPHVPSARGRHAPARCPDRTGGDPVTQDDGGDG